MALSAEVKADRKFIRQKAREYRDETEAIWKRFRDLLKKRDDEGNLIHTEESAMALVCDIYKCTPVRLNNIRNRVLQFQSPGMQSLVEADLVAELGRLRENVMAAHENAIMELDMIDEAEAAGEEWIAIEETKDTGARGGTKTKKISVSEARKKWMRERLDYDQYIFNAIQKLAPQTVLNQVFDQRGQASKMDDATLDAELGNMTNVRWKKNDADKSGEGG